MASGTTDPVNRTFLGHPVGLFVLFFTEMWERFSYYGMRAILIFYLTKYLMLSDSAAGGIYGDYTGLVYLTPLLGGFLADRYLGLQRSIIIGGLLMAAGQFTLAWHAWPSGADVAANGAAAAANLTPLWVGLVLLILGNGMFKPNISTIVGRLYEQGDPRRDSAFTIFYMGINIGANAPFIVGALGEKIGWHWGFLSAGIGMLLGVAVFLFGRHLLGGRGADAVPHGHGSEGVHNDPLTGGQWTVLGVAAAPGVLTGLAFAWTVWSATASGIESVRALMWPVIFSICVSIYVYLRMRCSREEMKKVNVIFVIAVFVMFFWAAFEQAGSTLNLFADRYVDREVSGWAIPASWFQNANGIFIVLFAPLFSWLWIRLARTGREPATPTKMAWGIFLQTAAYLVMLVGLAGWVEGQKVNMSWLILLYLLQTWGELCLSPVGLSMVTKLAPVRYGAMLMGVWFLSNAWANKLAGVGAGYLETLGPKSLFMAIAAILGGAGLVLVFYVPWLRRQMGEIH